MFYINRCNSTDKINKSRKYEHFKNLAKKKYISKALRGKGCGARFPVICLCFTIAGIFLPKIYHRKTLLTGGHQNGPKNMFYIFNPNLKNIYL